MKPSLYIVIPCYNEEAVLPVTAPMFRKKLRELTEKGLISESSRVLFVDDGSKDGTWSCIEALSREDELFLGIRLSRNRGHQNALLCGLMEAKELCDVTISIDCDGQDSIDAMDEMLAQYAGGCEIVCGVRSDRSSDSAFKRATAQGFYKLMERMGVETVYNHADYRLMSAKALKALGEYKEVNLFLRGMVPLVGYETGTVEYQRQERLAGKSHYPLKKMLELAVNGITSLSVKPIRLITWFGLLTAFCALIGTVWSAIALGCGNENARWVLMTCVICLFCGVQTLAVGVVGEYVGKTYLETKARPRYIVAERTWEK